MEFLHGSALTKEINKICKTRSAIKLAVAYWGQHALKLTGIDPKRRDVKLICCLKGGSSDPDIIQRFGARARQNDLLHAKVIWTSSRAIVSSANISSNGMPEEELDARGLVEAGVVITEPKQLSEISVWFDNQYKSGKTITKADLKKAREARASRLWGKPKVKRGLIDALRDGGAQEFKQQRIAFVLWKNATTKEEDRAASRHLTENSDKVEQVLKIGRADFGRLDWYSGWDDLPANTVLIDCHYQNEKIKAIWVRKTFDTKRSWPIFADGAKTSVVFALKSGIEGFDYRLLTKDKVVIRAAARSLWRKATGDAEGRVIKMTDAAPYLLRESVK